MSDGLSDFAERVYLELRYAIEDYGSEAVSAALMAVMEASKDADCRASMAKTDSPFHVLTLNNPGGRSDQTH